jgi:hypothetical protein
LLNYVEISQHYQPTKVTTLLLGESPPPGGESYFYIPKVMNPNRDINVYSCLPATIFYHYYKTIPSSIIEYEKLLRKLQKDGIFLMDICDLPLRIRDKNQPKQINLDNLKILLQHIPSLKDKINYRVGMIEEHNIIFLLARKLYKKHLKEHFPNAEYYTWKEFRTS